MQLQTDRKQILYIGSFLAAVLISIFVFPEGIVGVGIAVFGSLAILRFLSRDEDAAFLQQIFLVALLARGVFAALIYYLGAYNYFGGDATTYSDSAVELLKALGGRSTGNLFALRALGMEGAGWGMSWFVAFIYFFTGRNIFATMAIECVVGATTALLVYKIVVEIFNNQRAARLAACLVALFPAMIIWSSQALKDGLIVFLLVLMMYSVIRLQKQYSFWYTALLIASLLAILSLRFYIFYMAAIAVAGSFLVGTSNSLQEVVRRSIVFGIVGAALLYVGAIRNASVEFEKYGNLEAIQRSREDLSRAGSGFGQNLDVSTTEGALVALPIGLTYLMLAPFPWEANSLRQALVVPESVLWWCLLPFMVIGLWYTVKTRLRSAIAILIFAFMLTMAYSLFQGNIGTAYRQRTQIQVFLFIFIAVGIVIQREKAENRRLLKR